MLIKIGEIFFQKLHFSPEMAKKRIFYQKQPKMKKNRKNFKIFFFKIDLQSFKTYFKAKMSITNFFHLAGTEVGIPSVYSDFRGDGGKRY